MDARLLRDAFVVDTAWPLVLLPAVAALTHLAVLREERRLQERFGPGFERYRAGVRRYLFSSRGPAAPFSP